MTKQAAAPEMIELDWQPIETAPHDRPVLCGRWEMAYTGKLEWRQEDLVVFESVFFGLTKVRNAYSMRYSHWTELPPPPAALSTQNTEET